MKKIFAAVLCGCMILALAACGSEQETTQATETTEETEMTEQAELTESAEPAMSLWKVYPELKAGQLPDEAGKAFEKALVGYSGMGFEPIALLATQVVSGLNYAILCKGTVVVPNASPELKVVYIYADLQGNAQITDVVDFNLDNMTDSDPVEAGLAGGWTEALDIIPAELDKEAKDTFDQATEGLDGILLEPVAAIGRFSVGQGGIAYLVKTTTVAAEAESHLAVAFTVAEDDGGSSLSEISTINVVDLKG